MKQHQRGYALPVAVVSVISMVLAMFTTAKPAMAQALIPPTVQGVSPANVTMNLFDYWVQGTPTEPLPTDRTNRRQDALLTNAGINENHVLKFRKSSAGYPDSWNHYSKEGMTGIVKQTLSNDYPVFFPRQSDTIVGILV